MPAQPPDGQPQTAESNAVEPPRAPPRWDPVAERDARREARAAQRGPRASGTDPSRRRSRVPVERTLTCVAIVAIVVALAAIVGSWGAGAWVFGLVCSLATLALVSVLPAATTRRSADIKHRSARSRR